MKNVENINKRAISTKTLALFMAGVLGATAVGLTGCTKKEEKSTISAAKKAAIISLVDDTTEEIEKITPELMPEDEKNAAIILYLDIIARKDNHGKVSSEMMEELKTMIDVDNMHESFNSFLDKVELRQIKEGKVYDVSRLYNLLSEDAKANFTEEEKYDISEDYAILTAVEYHLANIIIKGKSGSKDLTDFNIIYDAVVSNKPIIINGQEYDLARLTPSAKAIAYMYARTALGYVKDFIPEYDKKAETLMDSFTQSKAYITERLVVVNNQMEDKSQIDVDELVDNKYNEIKALLNGKVNASNDTIENLVKYINIHYLTSEKVSYEDRTRVFDGLSDDEINQVRGLIEAINKYNSLHPNEVILYSDFMFDDFLATDMGKEDAEFYSFIQFNALMTEQNKDKLTDLNSVSQMPYTKNLRDFIARTTMKYVVNGKEVEIEYQNLSDGAKFVGGVTASSVLGAVNVDGMDNYTGIANDITNSTISSMKKSIGYDCTPYTYSK